MPLTFRVTTRHSGRKRAVTVKVYDTVEELRAAAEAFTRRRGAEQTGEFDRAWGVTHSFDSVMFNEQGEVERQGEAAALIRLWRQRLGTSVVTHEVCHAASGIYRSDCHDEHGPVHDDMDNEEIYCYLVGDLTARIVNRLYHYGMYAT
jgi:hypothetical protein